jgi:hypothetical protein
VTASCCPGWVVNPDFRAILMLTVWQHNDEHLVSRIRTANDISEESPEETVTAGVANISSFVRDWLSALQPRHD